MVIGLERENKFLRIDFCKERELESLVEQLAVENGMKSKDLYLVSPIQPDKELNLQKTLLG